MNYREKVIRALENCTDEIKCRYCPWETCETFCLSVKVPLDLAKAALSLLKAQERDVELLRNKGMNTKKADEAFERLRELLQEKNLGNAIYWFENQRDGLVSFAKENDNAEIEYILNEVEGAIDLLTALGLIDIAAAKEAREVFKEIDLSLMSD